MSQKKIKQSRKLMKKILRANEAQYMAKLYTGLESLSWWKRIIVALKIVF